MFRSYLLDFLSFLNTWWGRGVTFVDSPFLEVSKLREAANKLFRLVVRPPRGRGGKGRATKIKELILKLEKKKKNPRKKM